MGREGGKIEKLTDSQTIRWVGGGMGDFKMGSLSPRLIELLICISLTRISDMVLQKGRLELFNIN